jgi:hypothetical protein
MLTVNCPALVPEAFASCTHGRSAAAVHLVDPPVTLIVTVWAVVTAVSAPLAPAFVAPNRNHDGVARMFVPVDLVTVHVNVLLFVSAPSDTVAVTV